MSVRYKIGKESGTVVHLHGNPSGSPSTDWGANVESDVRAALAESSPAIARSLKLHPDAICSSDSPRGRSLGWIPANWRHVLVLTEYGIGDPHESVATHRAFTKAVEILKRNVGAYSDAGWDSYNAAVQYFWIRPSTANNPARDEEDCDTDILEGMTRALWVCAYADWFEGLTKAERKKAGGPVSLEGVDWSDVAPAAPSSAEAAARQLYRNIERANGKTPGRLLELAVAADGGGDIGEHAEAFGHYLAMQSLGHGVSWFDDHATFPLKLPRFETMYDGVDFVWSPQDRSNPRGRR